MKNLLTLVATLSFIGLPVMAQETDTVEELAAEEEVRAVTEAIAVFNCTATEVEKESDALFEIDDADCGEAGQFDIKLDGEYNIVSMTRD